MLGLRSTLTLASVGLLTASAQLSMTSPSADIWWVSISLHISKSNRTRRRTSTGLLIADLCRSGGQVQQQSRLDRVHAGSVHRLVSI